METSEIFETIIDSIDRIEESRDGETLVASYGSLGYFRLTPDYRISGGVRTDGLAISGKVRKANASTREALLEEIRALGVAAW